MWLLDDYGFHHCLFIPSQNNSPSVERNMIQSITIKNFQSHKKTHLAFSKGVNVIVGLSDCGKSSIIRAIRWCLFNKPSGDDFVSWWSSKCSVTVAFTDGSWIKRQRKGSSSIYKLFTDSKQVFKAFGQNVPEEISKHANIHDINCQFQLDSPFLLSQSPGDVAKTLNEVADLEVIDRTLGNLNSSTREENQRIEIVKEKEKELSDLFSKFKNVPEAETLLETAELLNSKKRQYSDKASGIKEMVEKIEEAEEKQKASAHLEESLSDLKRLERLIGKKLVLDGDILTLSQIVNCITKQQTFNVDKLLELDELKKQVPKVCPTCGQMIGDKK